MFQLKNIFSRSKSEKKKSYGVIYDTFDASSFLSRSLIGGSVSDYEAMKFYRETAAISTAVDMIAGAAEQIPLRLKNLTDGSFSSTDKVLQFLEKPNPAEDYRTTFGNALRNYLLTGNCYFVALGNINRAPLQLWSGAPSEINPIENGADSYVQSFLISGGGPYKGDYIRQIEKANWRYLTTNNLQELIQIRAYTSKSSKIKGDSPLESIMRDINQQIAGKIHNAAILQNGGSISLVAVFKDRLSPDEMMERKAALKSEIGGAQNAGKIAVIQSSDMELKDFGQSNKDMDYVNLDGLSTKTIYMRYNVPLALITTEASTYNNYQEARLDFYDRAVIPAFDIVTKGLSQMLLPRMGIDPRRFTLTYNPETIPTLRTRVLNELKLRKEISIETVNELRGMLPSRASIGPSGDVIYRPSNTLPLND